MIHYAWQGNSNRKTISWAISIHAQATALIVLLLAVVCAWLPAQYPRSATIRADAGFRHIGTWRLSSLIGDGIAPLDVAVGLDGTTYIADGTKNLVLVFDPAGNMVDTWLPSTTLGFCDGVYVPHALDLDPIKRRLYVLWVFHRATSTKDMMPKGAFVEIKSLDGTNLTNIAVTTSASDFAIDHASGNIYLSDENGLWRLDAKGNHVGSGFIPVGANKVGAGAMAVLSNGWLATVKRMGTVEINTGDGVRVRYLDIGHNVAVAVAADNDGQIHVLVRPQQPGPDEPMLLTFDGVSGKLMSSLTARDLGISTLPNSDWPFSLASAGAHQIAVSASDRFEVGGRGVKRIVGTTTRNAFDSIDLVGRMPCRRYPISLSVHGGEVIAVDGENGHVLRLERAGDVSLLGVAHADIVDATVHGEQLYLITANDRIERQSLSNLGKLEWEQPCNCLPDGRVAASGQTVFVAQPAARRVVGLDPVSGRATGYRRTHAGTGPWPADIVSSGSENLLTASLLDQEIEQWDSAGSLPSRWPAGYVVGPWRLTTTGGDKQAMVVAAMLDGSIEHYDPRFGLLLARWSPVVAGRVPRVADVAVDALGHVYIADPVLRMVYEFEPVGGEVPTPVDPQPSATPSSRSCNVTGSKIAAPHRVVLGSTLQVTLTLAARCPAAESAVGSDIILLIDYSPSEVATFAQKRTLSRSLVQMLDMRRHRVGLVGYPMGFEDDGHVLVALTSDAQAVIDGIDSLDPRRSPSQSFTGQALRGAARHLSEMGRPGALPVLVLMSDGGSDGTVNPIDIANRMRAAGVQIFTIGLSPNVSHDVLRAIAGSPERYYFAPAPEDMQSVYLQILHWATTSLAGNLVIEDEMGPDIDVISDSAIPHAIESGSRLEWSQPVVPGTGITMTYSIRPRRTGLLPTNRQAVAHYIDVDGSKREYVFPIPFVDVMAPTETATSTATPSPTTTPTPQIAIRPMYLPLLLHEQCTAVERRVDLALVLDTSSSMLELTPDGNTKLAAASSAAVGMLSQLRWVNGDQAALVTFNGDAALNQPLTGDSSAITGAFGQIVTNHQTRIHRGIELAYRELTSSRHNMSNLAVMVVLTDGHADPDPVSLAVEWASIAKAAGIEVFTIGLGQDLDAEALASMASKPQYFFTTVDPTALSAVFRQIAGTIPCRAEAFWGKR